MSPSKIPTLATHQVSVKLAGDECLHEAFERHAARTPDAIAVIDGARLISYAELDRRAQALSVALSEVGLAEDNVVGLLAERSVDAIVGLLGVLKAGCAYVPINPHDPDERISVVIQESGAAMALVQPHLRHRLHTKAGILDLSFDAIDVRSPMAATSATARTRSCNLAVIVYTSGSSGVPKGVEISHHSIMARVRNGYASRPGDLQRAPLNVVAHFSDVLLPLLSGRPVILVPDSCLITGRGLLEIVERHGTSRMVFVPSQLRALMEGSSDALAALGRLESVIVSGEPLRPALVRDFRCQLPHVKLFNAYGASEVAGLVCIGEVRSPDDITVGHPIAGCAVYVLDEDLNPISNDDEGELYIAGEQLARGYRQDSGRTAECFLTNPFGGESGSIYKTGDRAQRLKDGRIRLVGRRDLEVKIRGFRVNLNEVEACLVCLPGVRQAVVVSSATDVQTRLGAFVVPESFHAVDPSTLRTALAREFPSYMVPSTIRLTQNLPLLPNGKVDRVLLAASHSDMWRAMDSSEDRSEAPSTATERALAEIWKSLLSIQHVRTIDDFFALGGDSLDATRFIVKAEEAGFIVTSEQLADAPSLAVLARRIDESSQPAD